MSQTILCTHHPVYGQCGHLSRKKAVTEPFADPHGSGQESCELRLPVVEMGRLLIAVDAMLPRVHAFNRSVDVTLALPADDT